MKKIFIILFAFLLIGCNKQEELIKPDKEADAIIYHSIMLDFDDVIEYNYYIYKDNSTYIYFKYNKINEEEVLLKSGRIKNKNEFFNLERDIEIDYKKDSESFVSYDYYDEGTRVRVNTIGDLVNNLYKE